MKSSFKFIILVFALCFNYPIESTNLSAKFFLPNYLNLERLHYGEQSECLYAVRSVYESIFSKQRPRDWALKMFNSWSSGPLTSGFFGGKFTDLGNYDECLSIKVPKDVIEPKYCLVDWDFPVQKPIPNHVNLFHKALFQNNHSDHEYVFDDEQSVYYYTYLRVAICIPDICTNQDIENLIEDDFLKFNLNLRQITCQTKSTLEKWTPSPVQIIAIIFLIAMITLTLMGTVYDIIVSKSKPNDKYNVLLWFSVLENTKNLLQNTNVKNDELHCVHGIRFISITMVVVGHSMEWNQFNIFTNVYSIKNELSKMIFQPLYKAFYSVDTFFYLSGMLTSYMVLHYTKGQLANFNAFIYVLLRYVRLLPQLIVYLLLLSLLPAIFNGPIWPSYMQPIWNSCQKTWWQQLIFMQNILDLENICTIHTWYLGADMQLHWIALIPLLFLLKNRYYGSFISIMMILLGISISSITLFSQQMAPGHVITTRSDSPNLDGQYSKFTLFVCRSWNHMNVFFFGFLFGIYIKQKNLKTIRLGTMTKILYWSLAVLCYLFCIYSTVPWLYGRPYEPLWSALLYPLNQMVWCLMLTLLIWMCITGNGGYVGKIIGWSAFRSLSRLTYSIYLCHALVLFVVLGSRRTLIDSHPQSIILLCTSTLTMSILIGFIFSIIFEAPLVQMFSLMKNSITSPKPNNKHQEVVQKQFY